MNMNNGGYGSNEGDTPKKATGYKSPPLHGRIKPGEVRNPHGRNGRQVQEEDAFEKVRRRKGRVNFDGTTTNVMSDEAYWLKLMSLALAGNMAAARIVWRELAARRKLGPPPPTLEDLAEQEASEERAKGLTDLLMEALEMKAEMKRNEGLEENGLDFYGRPVVKDAAHGAATGPSNDPIE